MPNLTKSAVSHPSARYPLEAEFSGFVDGFTVIDHAGFRLRTLRQPTLRGVFPHALRSGVAKRYGAKKYERVQTFLPGSR